MVWEKTSPVMMRLYVLHVRQAHNPGQFTAPAGSQMEKPAQTLFVLVTTVKARQTNPAGTAQQFYPHRVLLTQRPPTTRATKERQLIAALQSVLHITEQCVHARSPLPLAKQPVPLALSRQIMRTKVR
jgi:hypothetical protein